jgi:3-keto-L-gulonate-6-phosphate decarboxylase
MMKPRTELSFQLSLDLADLDASVELAGLGVAAGIDVSEAGTILILSEGASRVIPRLRSIYPDHPIVADIKCMDGVTSEVGLMFELGAKKATVLAAASDASIRAAVRESERNEGCQVMVDTMGCGGPDGSNVAGHINAVKRARDLGSHYAILHLGYDERGANPAMLEQNLLLRWAEAVAREELGIPIQVVGGLTLSQAKLLPAMGIRDIVISMNLGVAGQGSYDVVTGFSVDLKDPDDRDSVIDRIAQFVRSVSEQSL